ncbi:MAG: diguanylate cyclase [Phycisphaerales bacterium]|nr:diguanylate cyclase [Phycisphaerales bacterium]
MSSPAPKPAGADLRVIVVGRGAVESRLRKDASIELIRAREPLDAIGELAHPIDDESPRRTAVLTPRGTVPPGEEREFVAALRRVDPGAMLIALESTTDGAERAGDGLYDAVAPAWLDAAELRRLTARGRAAPTIPAPIRAESRPAPAEAPVLPAVRSAPAAQSAPGECEPDLPILRAALSGAEIVGACVNEMRRRLADPSATFIADAEAPEPAIGRAAYPVEHRGRTLGWIVSREESSAALARCADWLACWLALREQQSQLRQAAFTDALTGVWNRRYFDKFLPSMLNHARARRHELSLLLFDIDNFKQFNDRFGHAAGDDILREVSKLLRSVVRPCDRVCRIGGDEFAVVFYEPHGPRDPSSRHPQSISTLAARFQRQVQNRRFPKLGSDAPGMLSVSGGLATFPWDAQDPESLIARADGLAMESKNHGKNMILFGPGHNGAGGVITPRNVDSHDGPDHLS